MMMVVLMGFSSHVVVLVAKVIAGKFQAVTINFPTKTVIISRALAQTIAIIIMVIYFNGPQGPPHLPPRPAQNRSTFAINLSFNYHLASG